MQPTWADRVSRIVLFAVEMAADLAEEAAVRNVASPQRARHSQGLFPRRTLTHIEPGSDLELSDVQPQSLHLLSNWPTFATAERVRKVLIYWLDDTFTAPAWNAAAAWRANSLEQQLLGSDDGATAFFQLAEQARQERDAETLRVCALCLQLGFQGRYRQQPSGVTFSERAEGAELVTNPPLPPATPDELPAELVAWCERNFAADSLVVSRLPVQPLLAPRPPRNGWKTWLRQRNRRWLWTVTGTASALALAAWLTFTGGRIR